MKSNFRLMNRTDAATVVGRVREEEEKARNKVKAHEKVEKLRVRNTVVSLIFRLCETTYKQRIC